MNTLNCQCLALCKKINYILIIKIYQLTIVSYYLLRNFTTAKGTSQHIDVAYRGVRAPDVRADETLLQNILSQ